MPIDCEVIPRAGASPAQLRALGSALLRWYVRECPEAGVAHSLDTAALIELLNGRPPPARVARLSAAPVRAGRSGPATVHLGGYEMPLPSMERLGEALREVDGPAASFRVRGSNYDRRRTIATLRCHIPAGLVEDVHVDGRSWDEDG
jgi:hypothetical protein